MTGGGPTVVPVAGPDPYEVVIGHGLLDRLPGLVGPRARRVAVLHPERLASTAGTVEAQFERVGYRVLLLPVPDGELAKTAGVAADCWAALGRDGFTRTDVVVGVGGGAVTDLAGFVAATWLRGVPVVHVPTTLLAMVDAAVGGKTGINTREGKNLVGAFHEPAGVLADLDLLRTLPAADLAAGLAEVVKCGFIADPPILDLLQGDPDAARDPSSPVLRELVERAVRVKAAVVAADLREVGGTVGLGREALNYGHTLGHAVERVEDYGVRHGDAVAVGLVFAAELARRAGRLDDDVAERHRAVLALLGLPTRYRGGVWPELMAAMRVDKKARGDLLRFVVLDGIARPGVLEAPAPELLEAAYATLAT